MKLHFRSILLTALFVAGILVTIQAQDKYEYAHVAYGNFLGKTGTIHISMTGKEPEKVTVQKPSGYQIYDYSDLLNYIQGMTDKGWEIITIMKDTNMDICYLKKKKS